MTEKLGGITLLGGGDAVPQLGEHDRKALVPLLPPLGAEAIQRQVAGDADQEGPQRGRMLGRDGLPDLEVGIVDALLGVGGVAEDVPGDPCAEAAVVLMGQVDGLLTSFLVQVNDDRVPGAVGGVVLFHGVHSFRTEWGSLPIQTIFSGESFRNQGKFLKNHGWEVQTAPTESGQVRIPEESSEVFDRYNALQKSQGYDLSKYAGEAVMRYVYQVENYPGTDEPVYATVLVYKNQIIGGDVTNTSAKGAIGGFKMPAQEENSLRTAMLGLPEKQRIAIELHYIEGYSVRETAKLLTVPEGTVKFRLHEGRKKLKEELIHMMKEEKKQELENI